MNRRDQQLPVLERLCYQTERSASTVTQLSCVTLALFLTQSLARCWLQRRQSLSENLQQLTERPDERLLSIIQRKWYKIYIQADRGRCPDREGSVFIRFECM